MRVKAIGFHCRISIRSEEFAMVAYRGKTDCTSSRCKRIRYSAPDGSMISRCFDWHCCYCHGLADALGVCFDRCSRYQTAEQQFVATVELVHAPDAVSATPIPRRVRILLNHRHARIYGYRASDVLREVHSYDEDPSPGTVDDPSLPADLPLIRRSFERFNIGTDRHAHQYFRARNRSLSIGDVIAIDDRYYACTETEWIPIGTPANIVALELYP
ncbi:hypothetical protein ABIA39_003477 [Nocardia sp. GAS34]|uniref:hypothetical protein n=1 Tax=unclassified Nocardia TaxID=2637762 RepID=UPI003D1A5705